MKMQKDFHLILDILFYFVLPIFLWECGREYLPDYFAMIFSSLPGICYSFFRYLKAGKLNFTRMFLLINILAGLMIDLFSGSAIRILWNDVFYSLGLCLIYVVSSLVNKPLFLYFSLDILVDQGYDRSLTKELLFEKSPREMIKILTFLNGIREAVYSLFLMSLIKKYGVELYSLSILIDQLFGVLMSVLTVMLFIYLYSFLNKMVLVKKVDNPVRKKWLRLSPAWYYLHFERCYFFIYTHHL
jgi:hypothetical protein